MSDAVARRVLIAEDSALVGLMIEDDLLREGVVVLGPFGSCSDALRVLRLECIDAAVIDIELRDGLCGDLARALKERRIPFVVMSGHTRVGSPPEFLDAFAWLPKPSPPEALIAALDRLFGSRVLG